eukprot:symbB.v1.2.019601.t1/scaffold1611.1/size109513/7
MEARPMASHCTRTDIRIALSSSTRSMLDQQTRSRAFSSGMPVAEIEENFLRRWKKVAGAEAQIEYEKSIQDPADLLGYDGILWSAGRRSLNEALRKDLGCEVRIGDSQKVIVFQIQELGGDAWHLSSLDLSGAAQQAGRVPQLRVMLRPGFEGACACWLWVFGLPLDVLESLVPKQASSLPRETLVEAFEDLLGNDGGALRASLEIRRIKIHHAMDREKNRALWPWQCHPERVIPSPLRRAHVLPPVGAQVIKSPVAGALREKLVKYRRYLELRAAERDPYLQALSFVAPKTAAPRSPLPRPPPVRPLRKRVKPASPGSAKTTRPGTRETNSFPEEGRPWTEPGKGRSRPSSRGPGSRDEGSKTRPDIESPLQEIAMALDLWNDALGSHFVRAPNALGWLEAMCGSGQLHSQTELCNVARRLGLSEEDAFRVAVALWALSDGKTLSLQLLVGALEDARELQLLAPDSSSVPLPRHLLGVNDQPEQMEVEVLETATNSGAEHGGR